jgi:2-polyprenyl-3-methyl-5-hydroxy-6-metoxy-1,4-benzoquinol methylase
LRASDPHWLGEAYSSAIADADTGLVSRNTQIAQTLASLLYLAIPSHGRGRYLDAAGGYGMLTRLMRDKGFDFYWADAHCKNLLATAFEYRSDLGECAAVSAIEVMEHLVDPLGFVDETLRHARSNTLIFTTQLYQGAVPQPDAWWYYTFATGQHIGFFTQNTLQTLGQRLGLRFFSANGMHVLSRDALHATRIRWATRRRAAQLFAPWIRHRLGSKTVSDHEAILRSSSPN